MWLSIYQVIKFKAYVRTYLKGLIRSSGTFTSSDVYPQSGTCARTVVSGNGVFTVNIEDGCSDTVAVIARRYDLDYF